jgi:low temperature requirement protein LtrA
MSKNAASHPLAGFRRYFWRPPRAHGEIIAERSVSFLELFYDLVYVVVVAQAAHHLAEHVTWRGVGEFAVVFGLIWIAWINGTMYHDLHGRGDGRTRTFVFIQMGLLVLLAVFTSNATGDDGQAFAVVYTLFLAVITWLWYTVRRQDDEQWRSMTTPYLTGMVISIVVVGASAFFPDDIRTAMWACLVIGWVIALAILDRVIGSNPEMGRAATDAMIERFGLLVIIVLGEVVVGVVGGITDADRSPIAIVTGMIALMIGFAFWWTYFDFVGGRRMRTTSGSFSTWILGHLPVTMAVASSGAAMERLIEHASDDRVPVETAWLLSGSVAVGLLALAVIMSALEDSERLAAVYRPVAIALGAAALVSLVIGLLRPAPWALAALLVATLMSVWFFAIIRWLVATDPDEAVPALDRS